MSGKLAKGRMPSRWPPQRQRGPDIEGAPAGADTKQRIAYSKWHMAMGQGKRALIPQRNPPQHIEDQISTGHMLEQQEMNEHSTFKVE